MATAKSNWLEEARKDVIDFRSDHIGVIEIEKALEVLYDAAYEKGQDEGHSDGYDQGFEDGKEAKE